MELQNLTPEKQIGTIARMLRDYPIPTMGAICFFFGFVVFGITYQVMSHANDEVIKSKNEQLSDLRLQISICERKLAKKDSIINTRSERDREEWMKSLHISPTGVKITARIKEEQP